MPPDQPLSAHLNLAHSEDWVSYCSHVNEDGSQCECAPALVEVVERLREIERVFNEGYLPAIPGEGATLKLKTLGKLRDLIPEDPGA